jgi:hypothetical protein
MTPEKQITAQFDVWCKMTEAEQSHSFAHLIGALKAIVKNPEFYRIGGRTIEQAIGESVESAVEFSARHNRHLQPRVLVEAETVPAAEWRR